MPEFNILVNVISGSGARKLRRELEGAGRSAKKASRGVQDIGGTLGGLTRLLPALGLAAIFKGATDAAIRQEKAIAQLEAGIESTGAVAGVTSADMQTLASQLQRLTGIGDEATIEMQSVLLTFTNIRDNLPRTTAVVQDLSARMGNDLQSAAVQVGKALNDPIANLSALGEAGIQFTDSQKQLIKSLVETGKLSEAQKIILAELETQFGGSAEAARNTLGGALEALGAEFGDLGEKVIGTGSGIRELFIEPLVRGLQFLNDNWDALRAATFTSLGQIARKVGDVIGFILEVFQGATKGIAEFGGFLDRFLPGDQAGFVQALEAGAATLGELAENARQAGRDIEIGMGFNAEAAIDDQVEAWRQLDKQIVSTAAAVTGSGRSEGFLAALTKATEATKKWREEMQIDPPADLSEVEAFFDRFKTEAQSAAEDIAELFSFDVVESEADAQRIFAQLLETSGLTADEIKKQFAVPGWLPPETIDEIFNDLVLRADSAAGELESSFRGAIASIKDAAISELGGLLADVLGDGLSTGELGDRLGGFISSLGPQIGSALGESLGGPGGAIAGEAIAQIAGQIVTKVFEGSRDFAGGRLDLEGGFLSAGAVGGNKKGRFGELQSLMDEFVEFMNGIFGQIDGLVTDLGATFDLIVQDDQVIANINGVQRAFNDAADAMEFLALEILQRSNIEGLGAGVGDAIKQAAQEAGGHLEQFQSDLADIQRIAAASAGELPESAQRLKEAFAETERLIEQAARFGLDDSGIKQGLEDFLQDLKESVTSRFRPRDTLAEIRHFFDALRREAEALNRIALEAGEIADLIDIEEINEAQRRAEREERRRRRDARNRDRQAREAERQAAREGAEDLIETFRDIIEPLSETDRQLRDLEDRYRDQFEILVAQGLATDELTRAWEEARRTILENAEAAEELARAEEEAAAAQAEAARQARLAQESDALGRSANQLLLGLLDATDRSEEAARLRFELDVAARELALLELEQRAALLEAEGVLLEMVDDELFDRLRSLLEEFRETGLTIAEAGEQAATDIERAGEGLARAARTPSASNGADAITSVIQNLIGRNNFGTTSTSPFAGIVDEFSQIFAVIDSIKPEQNATLRNFLAQLGVDLAPGESVAEFLRGLAEDLRSSDLQAALEQLTGRVRDFADSLLLSDLSPLNAQQRLGEAQSAWEELIGAILQGGDLSSIEDVPAAAQSLLDAMRAVTPLGSVAFEDAFNQVQSVLDMISSLTVDSEGNVEAPGTDDIVFELQEARVVNVDLLTQILEELRTANRNAATGSSSLIRGVA